MGKFNANLIKLQALSIFVSIVFSTACSNDRNEKARNVYPEHERQENKFYNGKGVGPVQILNLENDIDKTLANTGELLFTSKCTSCHKLSSEKGIGPGLKGITNRRRPEWIMNMILNPMEMTQKDSLAKELLAIYYSQMLDNNLTHQEARSILEFLRTSK